MITKQEISTIIKMYDDIYPGFVHNVNQDLDEMTDVINYLSPRKFKNFVEIDSFKKHQRLHIVM